MGSLGYLAGSVFSLGVLAMYNTLPVAYGSGDAILPTGNCDGMTEAWKWCGPTGPLRTRLG